jgi:hypothetical protein
MKYLILLILLPYLLLAQHKSIFADSSRGYLIEYPNSFSLKGGSYALHPTKVDTNYIAFFYDGKRVLFGDFNKIDQSDFKSHAINLTIGWSAADGPNGSTYCKNIDSVKIEKNKYGVIYAELFLRKISEKYRKSKSEIEKSEIVGPYFVVDISTKNKRQSLYLNWRANWKPTLIQTKLSKVIVDNIKLIK